MGSIPILETSETIGTSMGEIEQIGDDPISQKMLEGIGVGGRSSCETSD